MRNPNTQITAIIKEKTLGLLMKKNPEQIGMRDIAAECKITATNIYHYYKDKDQLFQAVSLDCLNELNKRIEASVKGGDRIGFEQAEKLIDELLTLDNPYNCPHGRPTIISMSKYELEKRFKRVVD